VIAIEIQEQVLQDQNPVVVAEEVVASAAGSAEQASDHPRPFQPGAGDPKFGAEAAAADGFPMAVAALPAVQLAVGPFDGLDVDQTAAAQAAVEPVVVDAVAHMIPCQMQDVAVVLDVAYYLVRKVVLLSQLLYPQFWHLHSHHPPQCSHY